MDTGYKIQDNGYNTWIEPRIYAATWDNYKTTRLHKQKMLNPFHTFFSLKKTKRTWVQYLQKSRVRLKIWESLDRRTLDAYI